MRHPFDGLNTNDGMTRRGALAAAVGAVVGLAGVGNTAQAGFAIDIIEQSSEGTCPTTEPFSEEAGNVVSRVELEEGRQWTYQSPEVFTAALGEQGQPRRRDRVVHIDPATLTLTGDALKKAWRNLGSRDACIGVQGCVLLYGAKDGVAFLQANLKPETVTVPDVDRRAVNGWIEELDASAFKVREAAEKELEKAGASAVTAMKRALNKPRSLEQRKRLERLLEQAEDNSPIVRGKRALEVLVALHTPEAIKVLEGLARGEAKEWLTEAAREARDRISKSQQQVQ